MTGAINVLPSDSILSLCNGNATLIEPHLKMIDYNYTTVPDNLKFLQSIDATADVGSHTFFACYYSIFAVVDPQTYANLFAEYAIVFNLLYNLGYMYTDITAITTLDPATYTNNYDYWF